jgi:hypothetical protein
LQNDQQCADIYFEVNNSKMQELAFDEIAHSNKKFQIDLIQSVLSGDLLQTAGLLDLGIAAGLKIDSDSLIRIAQKSGDDLMVNILTRRKHCSVVCCASLQGTVPAFRRVPKACRINKSSWCDGYLKNLANRIVKRVIPDGFIAFGDTPMAQ